MKKNTQFLIVAALIALIAAFVCADISVHCLHEQIVGTWKFSMTNVLIQNQKLLDKRVFLWCNRTDEAYGYNTQNYVSDVYVKLVKPNKALVYDKDDSNKIINSGTWTMIYDQGFEVIIDQKKFFAFNDFVVEKNGEFVTSFCGKTQAGWFHNVDGDTEYGCFKGEKVNSNDKTDTVTTKVVNNALHSYMYQKFKNEHELVSKLNEVQKGWTAKAYKEYDRLTVGQMRGRAGHKVSQHEKPKSLVSDDDQAEALGDGPGLLSGNSQRGNFGYEARVARAKLPKAWDWRNVSGENYVSQVRHQQSCGSCYIFATMTMLESRVRIQSKNKDQVVLAPQDVVSCSLYSQLCHGGFPYLASKYVQDFYVVPEDCFPYKATSDLSCNKKCATPSYRVGVSNYTYIGGFYGASSELSMMKEIYSNGPIAVSFLVYPDFSYYSKGVYTHIKGIAGNEARVKHGGVNPWEPVTHSVAIVGWGVDEENTGHKYWIVKNSWGEDWGEAGYFRIRKGVDECSIESEAVAAMPYLQRL